MPIAAGLAVIGAIINFAFGRRGSTLQTGAKNTLRPARPARDAAQLALVPSQKTDNQIRFPEGVRPQYYRFAHPSRHVGERR